MKEVSYRLRKALADLISPVSYSGQTIPVFDSTVNPRRSIPTINNGQVYIVISSQTNTETTNDKCKIRLDANVSFDVVTKYPSGYGGNFDSEKIGEIILLAVNRTLVIPDFLLLDVKMNFNQNPIERGTSQDAYRKLISYRFDVFES
jgi:hypothetical protein